jgi:hypothetical protein
MEALQLERLADDVEARRAAATSHDRKASRKKSRSAFRRAPARLASPLPVEARQAHRPIGLAPLIKRFAEDPGLVRQITRPLARLKPANQSRLLLN